MARRDLEEMRVQILDTFYLTREEIAGLKYWHEDKLRETLALFEAITEIEQEFEGEESDEEYREPMDFPDYYEEIYYDDYGWEYEAVLDYGND